MSDTEKDGNKSENEEPEVKEDGSGSEADSPAKEEKVAKSPKKEAAKSETKVEKEDEDEDDDDDEDEEGGQDLPPGLLEQPLEVSGKRTTKKVERLSAAMINPVKEKKKVEIEEGKGTKLGEIEYIEHQLEITKAKELMPLHRVIFMRIAPALDVKKNIRQFCGSTHGKDTKEYEKRTQILNKMFLAELKTVCTWLGLERSGTKPDIVERIMDFLLVPHDKGLKVKSGKKTKSQGGKKATKRKRTSKGGDKKEKKKVTKPKKKAKKESEDEMDDDDDEEEEEEEDKEEEEEEEEEESEEEAPKKKKAKVEKKPKKAAKENGKKEKATPKKKVEKKKPPPKKTEDLDDLSDDLSDSDDEPIAKMKKPSPPSNDEIKDLVKKILEGADLETVTMKTVVKQVYAKYPSFDLSDRKDFIKDTVREVIS